MGQHRLATAALRDHPDPVHTPVCEPGTPPSARVGVDPAPSGDLLVRHTIRSHYNAFACITVRCGNDEEPAIRFYSTRCSSVTGNAGAVTIGTPKRIPCYLADRPLRRVSELRR